MFLPRSAAGPLNTVDMPQNNFILVVGGYAVRSQSAHANREAVRSSLKLRTAISESET